MPSITAQNMRIEYQVMQSTNRSLKRRVVSTATGGRIARDVRDHVSVAALDDVSFSIGAGERVALVGHNGSGKTTLLRAMAGVYEPMRGSLHVDGSIASLVDISIGFDTEATGRENIYLRGFVMGMSRTVLASRMEDIQEFSGLGEYLELPVRCYSSGMLLRLAFAVATTVSRDIVLMDEWLSVGDSEFAVRAEARLKRYVERSSILILATHNEALARRICTRRIELNHGRIAKDELLAT